MKARVVNVFRDKNTGIVHEIGAEIEMTKKRFAEINATAFGVFVEALPVEATAPEE